MDIGRKLSSIRVERGITQVRLVELSGIPQPRISEIEKGKRDMTVSTLVRLCRALDIAPARLFENDKSIFKKESFSRERLERIARAVWDYSLAKSDAERKTAELLAHIVPIHKIKKSRKAIYEAWRVLREHYSSIEIKSLVERVRDEEQRRHAKKDH